MNAMNDVDGQANERNVWMWASFYGNRSMTLQKL